MVESDCRGNHSNCQGKDSNYQGTGQITDGRTQVADGRVKLPGDQVNREIWKTRKPRGKEKTDLGAGKIRKSSINLYNNELVCHHLSRTHTVRIPELC